MTRKSLQRIIIGIALIFLYSFGNVYGAITGLSESKSITVEENKSRGDYKQVLMSKNARGAEVSDLQLFCIREYAEADINAPCTNDGCGNEPVFTVRPADATTDDLAVDASHLESGDLILPVSGSSSQPGVIDFSKPQIDDEQSFASDVPVMANVGRASGCNDVMHISQIQSYDLEPMIQIEKTYNSIQGTYEYVSVTMENCECEMGGFDFLIAYDASALSFVEATKGQLLEDCDWEYFTYRDGAEGNCGDSCPSGLLRIVAMAETNNGLYHPSCFGPSDTASHELAKMRFYVTDDRIYECQYVPIRFFWGDCGDNSISNVEGDILWISDHVYDFEGTEITGEIRYGGHWWLGDCQNPDTTKPSAVPFIDYVNGGISIVCADSIDFICDLNLDNLPYTVADAVLYVNYFIYGSSIFMINPTGQMASSDCNNDGRPLTVGDLTYLIRVITGDADPLPKFAIGTESASVGILVNHSAVAVSANSAIDIGTAQFVIEHSDYNIGEPHLINGASAMTLKYNDEDGILKVLVYSMEKDMKISAGTENIFVIPIGGKGNIRLTEVQLSDYYGNMLNTTISKGATLPKQFALHQNYPNPFNATTQIVYELPSAAHVKIEVFNILGQKVTTLFDDDEIAGVHRVEWDGTDGFGNGAASGIYLYRLITRDFATEKKMTLMK